MPHFNPFTPCANTVRRMSHMFRKETPAHIRTASAASSASGNSSIYASMPSTPTTPTFHGQPYYFMQEMARAPSPVAGCRSLSTSSAGSSTAPALSSPSGSTSSSPCATTAFFSDPAAMDVRSPYRRRSRPQMLAATTVTVGAVPMPVTTSIAYTAPKRNSVSSNRSYGSCQSLSGIGGYIATGPGASKGNVLDDEEIREPTTERLRRRISRMARKMKRKMSDASRKLRRNGKSADNQKPQQPTTEATTGARMSTSERAPAGLSVRSQSAPASPNAAAVATNEDPWMELEWQF